MGLSGGDDRSQLRPLRPDGTVDHDMAGHHIVGNHKGDYSGFNIADPAPGTVHQWGTNRDVYSARQRGWWVADPERDGRPATELVNLHRSDTTTPGDSFTSVYPDYVHLVTTEENYRRLMQEQLERNRAQLGEGGAEFLGNVSQEEYETGRTESGVVATRFATRDHGTRVMQGDQVVEHFTPRGILREEEF